MADYISREAATNALCKACGLVSCDRARCFYFMALKGVPAADVVGAVRCKNCLHRRRNGTCEITPAFAYMSDTDFCSHGKRRMDNGN